MSKKQTISQGLIEVKGAKVHNLKNVSINIPRDKLIVITGLSGSGKSSLAFDTIYAEGQRRYVESLSAYARQFLGRMNKPEVDYIKGLPPAIAIEQKVNTQNPRSTVGTATEIYDYLKLLYARIGKTISPASGNEVKKDTVTSVIDDIKAIGDSTKATILVPVNLKAKINLLDQLSEFKNEGFVRVEVNDKIYRIDDLLEKDSGEKIDSIFLIIDRITYAEDEDTLGRLADSLQLAFKEGDGNITVRLENKTIKDEKQYSDKFEADGIEFEEPTVHMFSFNNPLGACPNCQGYGKVIGVDPDLVIPDKRKSVYDDAVVCWKGEVMSQWKKKLIVNSGKFDFPIHKPYYELTKAQKKLLWDGNRYFGGIHEFFAHLEENKYKIQYRVMLARYRGKTTCPTCNGARLKQEASHVKVADKNIPELVLMPISNLQQFFNALKLNEYEQGVAGRVLVEINNRLDYMISVGLGYLTLNRLSSTLSGGESQRINLATSLGSSLVGSLYILDEPSIGLHPKDTSLLIQVLKNLKEIGNTVLVVEHDEEIMRSADELIDIGPEAGRLGGKVVFTGTHDELIAQQKSLTAKYLTGKEIIPVPKVRRKWNNYVEVKGAREHNLKNIDVKFPLNAFTVITGVSGSGKSTLMHDILYPLLSKLINSTGGRTGECDGIDGAVDLIKNVEYIDQDPIGKSSRSNPATYIKVYDEIRKLFSSLQASKIHGFKPSHFSFNVDGGRCDECQGEGEIKVEMQFMADIHLVCESCGGKRFKPDVLEVEFHGKNIHDILDMTIDEAIDFFGKHKLAQSQKIAEKLQPLIDVGLGYVKLGQSSSTLSGGESQRVKLAYFLSKESLAEAKLFIFDEPTTGLHFHDIKKLLKAFDALIENGHSVIVIEHNLDVIKCADWIVDLGPEGGDKGGNLVFAGIPEDLIKCEESYTAKYIKGKLAG